MSKRLSVRPVSPPFEQTNKKKKKAAPKSNKICVKKATCFCYRWKYKPKDCPECRHTIRYGDCVRRNEACNWVHSVCTVTAPRDENNKPILTRGQCEKKSLYGKCGCIRVKDHPICINCRLPIESYHCFKRLYQPPEHKRCGDKKDLIIPTCLPISKQTDRVSTRKEVKTAVEALSSAATITETTSRRVTLSPQKESGSPLHLFLVGDICIQSHPWQHNELGIKEILEIVELQKEDDGLFTEETVAICNVYVALGDTTIGETEAKKLYEECNYKLQRVAYARMPKQKALPIRSLELTNAAVLEELEKGDLVWEPIQRYGNSLWTFAYSSSTTDSPEPILMDQPLIGMDLFAGAGGISQGFYEAGLKVKYCVEVNAEAVKTLKHNFPDKIVYQEDVRTLLEKMMRGELGPKPGEIIFLHVSPPCQGHSIANIFRGGREAENNSLTLVVLEYVRFLQPKVFTFENVLGIVDNHRVDGSGRTSFSYFQELIAGLVQLGYQVRAKAVDAKDYGDPQTRTRVIIIAVKNGYVLPHMPPPTHGKAQPYKSAKDAIGNLKSFEPTGVDFPMDGQWVSNHSMISQSEKEKAPPYAFRSPQKLKRNEPAPTIRCEKAFRHYSLNRNITPRERARLQSFPDDYYFHGNYLEVCRQIGNAVPICLAKALGETIYKWFDQTREDIKAS